MAWLVSGTLSRHRPPESFRVPPIIAMAIVRFNGQLPHTLSAD